MSLQTVPSNKTMLSTEIAELTGKEHRNVTRDIEVIIEQLHCSNLSSGIKPATYKSANGQQYKCYELDHEATMVVVTGYDVVARTKVIKRWMELEKQASEQPAYVLPTNFVEALEMLVVAEKDRVVLQETVKQKQAVILEQAPKVLAHDRLTLADGTINITDAAKTLDVNPRKMFGILSELKWIYRRAGGSSWIAYQDKIQSGYLKHKVTTLHRDEGDKITEQVRVTPKGLTKLASLALN
jgi:phage antirepressor YoqD-like protein